MFRRCKRSAIVLSTVFAVWYFMVWTGQNSDSLVAKMDLLGAADPDHAYKDDGYGDDGDDDYQDDDADRRAMDDKRRAMDDKRRAMDDKRRAMDDKRSAGKALVGDRPKVSQQRLEEQNKPAPYVDNTRVHVLLLAYMRTGSSMTGRIFKLSQSGVFYWYEPLHWLERHYVTGGHPQQTYKNVSLVEQFTTSDVAKGNVSALLNCDIEHVYRGALLDSFVGFSSQTRAFAKCFSDAVNDTAAWRRCAQNMSKVCRSEYSVTAMKCIRLTMLRALEVMREDPKVKVVHLFRDPRAVMLSRSKIGYTRWTVLQTEAAGVCARMSTDLLTIRNHVITDPDIGQRYVIVRYEDIVTAPALSVQRLYALMGLQPSDKEMTETLKMIMDNSTNRTATEIAQSWRNHITLEDARVIANACSDVMTQLGYRLDFADKAELNDFHLPSFGEPLPNIASHLLLRT